MSDENMWWQFFVCGLNEKSGTTWLEKMLDAHPFIYCKSESDFIQYLNLLMQATEHHRSMVSQKDHELHRHMFMPSERAIFMAWTLLVNHAMHQYTLEPKGGYRWVGDKTPNYSGHLPMMLECFPYAKFVVITRDIRDACASGWIASIRTSPQWIQKDFGGEMFNYAKSFAQASLVRANAIAQAYQKDSKRVLVVRYEDMLKDLSTNMEKVSTFITGSVEHVDTMMKAGKWENFTEGRKRGVEDKQSFFRKGVAGDYKNVLCLKSIENLEVVTDEVSQKIDSCIPVKA